MDELVSVTTGNRNLRFGPAPASYSEAIDLSAAPSPDRAMNGVAERLLDFGHDLSGTEEVWTMRSINEVTTADGLQFAANFNFSFDPTFETATVHTVRVWRGGVAREVGAPEAFQLLQREPNLERARIDGSLTASLVIPDVRVGDIVETCHSIAGGNPALRGAFSAIYALQWNAPGALRRYRLTTARHRKIITNIRGLEPEYDERAVDDAVERLWTLRDVPAFAFEPDTPSWHVGVSQLAVADELSWADIADVHRRYYEQPVELSADLDGEIAVIAAQTTDLKERARLALHLVQSQIRYHAISVGAGGYQPRLPDEVWRTRFGDCKDTSRLLVTIAQRLGLEACPVLVNVGSGEALDQLPPSVRAFNHCIVRLTIDGEVFWLDPTRGSQGGRLDVLLQSRLGFALPLVAGASLVAMGEYSPLPLLDVSEVWTFGPTPRAEAQAEVVSLYESWRADDLRRVLANDGEDAVAKRLADGFERGYGQLEVLERATFEDDLDTNRITVRERYKVLKPFRPIPGEVIASFTTTDEVVSPFLVLQETLDRVAPIDLGTPRRVTWSREFHFGFPVEPVGWARDWSASGVHYQHRAQTLSPKHHRQEQSIEFSKGWAPAAEAKELYEFCRKVRNSNGYSQTVGIDQSEAISPVYHAPTKQNPTQDWANIARVLIPLVAILLGMTRCLAPSPDTDISGYSSSRP